ncbi:2-oxo-4-hydroxy-4-carboxy-5-ureidoimidazoline decarboxylase [Roseobacter litoralis]|uniref:2-oxo-4-hydroxy-4-carboxy-5-ureidoimidazoline decarboxylase n=1 Tax=Roseobacter litoralis TaxID=42443 RepID=UPI002491AA6B|nr:2-oxo-4-hydroxy-4-carboxy-5-ureidoimidazoline decarboxylase [Roseobacter litoralis]
MPDTAPLSFSISALNRATDSQAAAMMDRVVERSPWLAHRAAAARPFRDADHLAAWLATEVSHLSHDEAVLLLCAHPELSPSDPANITQASQNEQGRLRLLRPDLQLSERLSELNRRYLRHHGYPFVIALHAQTDISAVIAQFEHRLAADPDEELTCALGEVVSVMRARLAKLAGAMPTTNGAPETTFTSVTSTRGSGP